MFSFFFIKNVISNGCIYFNIVQSCSCVASSLKLKFCMFQKSQEKILFGVYVTQFKKVAGRSPTAVTRHFKKPSKAKNTPYLYFSISTFFVRGQQNKCLTKRDLDLESMEWNFCLFRL